MRILIVDDEQEFARSFAEFLEIKGHTVSTAAGFDQALAQVDAFRPDLLTLDLELSAEPGKNGLDLLAELRRRQGAGRLPVLVISGTGNTDDYFRVMGLDAGDYLMKPVDFRTILEKIEKAAGGRPPDAPATAEWEERLLGRSKVMINLAKAIYLDARTLGDTLILGETGTGKSLVARTYHRLSVYANKPFYRIDCTRIPPNLFETEVFGYAPGSHSLAKQEKKGMIEEAQGGVLFFDEIGELPLEQQPKLLTLLESKTFTRVGETRVRELNGVILAATNCDLYTLVQAGRFRKDLYYRLHNTVIVNPPLRDHPEDIPELVEHFLQKYSAKLHKPVSGVAPEVLAALQALPWEGNVRQLMNVIEAGVKHAQGEVLTPADLQAPLAAMPAPRAAAGAPSGAALTLDLPYAEFKDRVLTQIKRDYFIHHLEKHGWNITRTARALGFTHRQQLGQYLDQLRIRPEK
jgi:two-component system, NtrC family, response regulator AtoC